MQCTPHEQHKVAISQLRISSGLFLFCLGTFPACGQLTSPTCNIRGRSRYIKGNVGAGYRYGRKRRQDNVVQWRCTILAGTRSGNKCPDAHVQLPRYTALNQEVQDGHFVYIENSDTMINLKKMLRAQFFIVSQLSSEAVKRRGLLGIPCRSLNACSLTAVTATHTTSVWLLIYSGKYLLV